MTSRAIRAWHELEGVRGAEGGRGCRAAPDRAASEPDAGAAALLDQGDEEVEQGDATWPRRVHVDPVERVEPGFERRRG